MAKYKPLPWYTRLQCRLRLFYWQWRYRHVDYVSMRDEQQLSFYQWSRQATPDLPEDAWEAAKAQVAYDISDADQRARYRAVKGPAMYDDTWEGSY